MSSALPSPKSRSFSRACGAWKNVSHCRSTPASRAPSASARRRTASRSAQWHFTSMLRMCISDEPLLQKEALMPRRIIVEGGEHLVAEPLVERARLVAERVEMREAAATRPGGVLEGGDDLPAVAAAPQRLR